jgi:hypothetical protein
MCIVVVGLSTLDRVDIAHDTGTITLDLPPFKRLVDPRVAPWTLVLAH